MLHEEQPVKKHKFITLAALMMLTGCNINFTMTHTEGADSGSVKDTSEADPDVSAEVSIPAGLN